MSTRAGSLFESLVRTFLSQHFGITHEWKVVKSLIAGNRLDLIFPNRPSDVWVTIREDQIAVGCGPEHEDFEANGKSAESTAKEAFAHLKGLMQKARVVVAQPGVPTDGPRPAGRYVS